MLAVLLLGLAFFSKETILAVLAFLLICKMIAYYQRSKLDLVYDKENKFFQEFVSKS